jgi:hypothetical protein
MCERCELNEAEEDSFLCRDCFFSSKPDMEEEVFVENDFQEDSNE